VSSDPLSDLVSLLSIEKAAWSRLEASGKWALRFPATAMLKFIKVVKGSCYAFPERGEALSLARDDMLMLLNAEAYVVASDSDVAARDGAPLFADPEQRVVRVNGDDTVLCSVHYTLASEKLDLLVRLLPRFFLISAEHPASTGLRHSNELLLGELREPGAGSARMIGHLCEMLLLQTVRVFLSGSEQEMPGWLGGLADEHVGRALGLMHERPERSFSLERLAREVGISRAGLASQFREKVGMPPFTYLTWWRMQLARRALETRAQPLATLSSDLGYRSESAFGTAFKRQFGVSPGQYARAIRRDAAGVSPRR
jgi:AraC-like DNA-binding protein